MNRRIFAAALALALFSCAPTVRTEPLESLSGLREKLNLIYYVGTRRDDLGRAVVLDVLGDGYEFVPEVEDYEYEILQDISIGEAVYETRVFFGRYPFITGPVFKRILNEKGFPIGYEIRPRYHPKLFGKEDVLEINYHSAKNNLVHIRIKLRK